MFERFTGVTVYENPYLFLSQYRGIAPADLASYLVLAVADQLPDESAIRIAFGPPASHFNNSA
ncbi:MAG: hypothetical protein WBW53_21105, partial [Terriglobales bacterium]